MSSLNGQAHELERISELSHYLGPNLKDLQLGGPNDPQLILLFGWLGAKLPQLMKYSTKYSEMYPAAAQVIIGADNVAAVIGSRATNVKRQTPILEKLAQLGLFGENPPRVLIHIFSGGGAIQLLWLALAQKSRAPKLAQNARALACLVIDSAPGSFKHADARRTFTTGLTGFTKQVGLALASLVYIGGQTKSFITGTPSGHNFIRDGLNDPQIFPFMDSATPRLYLYSDSDRFSPVGSVKDHIEAAKQKGLNIQEEYFLGSPHVQHSRIYPDRYWDAVTARWGDTVRSKL
ncbi:hypothetical protein DFH06DRAFT_1172597 [Mycena polygramma]|nr:hypothetical protein DFH06DRAFT_1172597 [Mycena polygramma]